MALDALELMRSFGFERFFVCGHDRGGRVAHRLALDHPQSVARLMVLDISPTLAMYERTTMDFATLYYHWFFLIQPEPMPETLIAAHPRFYLRNKLGGWGSAGIALFDPRAGRIRALLYTGGSARDVRRLSRRGVDRSRA